jgi:hypothetical protein
MWLKSVGASDFTPPVPGRWSRPMVSRQNKSRRVVGVGAVYENVDIHSSRH